MAAGTTRVYRFLLARWWLALLLLGLSFVLFGIASLNLVGMLSANLRFLAEHGIDAVHDGALMQLCEIAFYGYLAAVFYVLFKVCEKALVTRVTESRQGLQEQ